MRKLLIILLFFTNSVFAQNLVPNPSFEDTVQCPYPTISTISFSQNWQNPPNCIGTADYFHECSNSIYGVPSTGSGFQHAKTGSAFAGITTHYRGNSQEYQEYLTVQLISPLEANHNYNIGLWFSCGDLAAYSGLSKDVGIQFSNQILTGDTVLDFILGYTFEDTLCIDTLNYSDWININGTYTANGGEEYLTIGCFHEKENCVVIEDPNIQNSFVYTFIDDVYVIPTGEVSVKELNNKKVLLRIVDMLGKESKPQPNAPLFYIFDDGTVEKRIIVE